MQNINEFLGTDADILWMFPVATAFENDQLASTVPSMGLMDHSFVLSSETSDPA